MSYDDLRGLANPQNEKFNGTLNIENENSNDLIEMLNTMILIRKVEEKISYWIETGKTKCPCHLAIGQEAVAVGIARNLHKSDRLFGTHRSHSQFLALGGSADTLLAEILGKKTGCSGGLGGSMHLIDEEVGFGGSVPIVGGTIPIAVGAGISFKLLNTKPYPIGVCFFGDGAVEEGCFHESMNFAANFKLPVLFVCENNLFSSHLHIDLRQPSNSVQRFAEAHRMSSVRIDGNDVIETKRQTADLIETIRNGEGPGFVEAITYRWKGHVGHRDDIDVGVARGKELMHWMKRDPIRRLSDTLIDSGSLTTQALEEIQNQVQEKVEKSARFAEDSDYPDPSVLMSAVYKNGKHYV